MHSSWSRFYYRHQVFWRYCKYSCLNLSYTNVKKCTRGYFSIQWLAVVHCTLHHYLTRRYMQKFKLLIVNVQWQFVWEVYTMHSITIFIQNGWYLFNTFRTVLTWYPLRQTYMQIDLYIACGRSTSGATTPSHAYLNVNCPDGWLANTWIHFGRSPNPITSILNTINAHNFFLCVWGGVGWGWGWVHWVIYSCVRSTFAFNWWK